MSKIKLQKNTSKRIVSYYFEVAKKVDYWIFAQSYLPEKQKFTQLIALPIQNVLKAETYNEI